MDTVIQLSVAGVAGLVSVCVVVLWARLAQDPDQSRHALLAEAQAATIFLFDGQDLVDCSGPARRLFDELGRVGNTDLQRLFLALNNRFVGLPPVDTLIHDASAAQYPARDPEDPTCLRFDMWDGYARIQMTDQNFDLDLGLDDVTLAAQADELRTLRTITNDAPFLMWQTNAQGEIDWANEAYVQTSTSDGADPLSWPPKTMFPITDDDTTQQRMSVLQQDGKQAWYDVTKVAGDGKSLWFATQADKLVQAEQSQRGFVQTLTKTFAHLSIGLVIFDRKRSLVLFNPAVLDLLGLPIEFLSQRPTLQRFLDRLREERLIAEPKDYPSWRKHMTDLEVRAENGTYCETWPLPGGVTFRVTGRPHPDGAIAFLFEDISSEVSLTRRFHAEIALGRQVLDQMEEAVAVFSDRGDLVMTNEAYRSFWNCDPDSMVVAQSIQDALQIWEHKIADVGIRRALSKLAHSTGRGKSWIRATEMPDGRAMCIRVSFLDDGSTMIGFRPEAEMDGPSKSLAQRRMAEFEKPVAA